MTVILRLQGLDVKAGTEDIRKFFESFHIPDGGVYIVGGSLREAFIAFTTERDARLAMRHNDSFLKGSKVTLHISSMAELEHKLKTLIKKKKASPTQLTAKSQPSPDVNLPSLNALPHDHNNANPSPTTARPVDPRTANLPQPPYPKKSSTNLHISAVNSLDSNTAFLLGICTVLQGLQSSHQRESNEAGPRVDFPKADSTVEFSDVVRTPELTLNSEPGYVRLFGLPASATKEDICHFFRELTVQEAIVNVKLGLRHCCLVKFANTQDACDALHFNQQSLGNSCVEVRGATEKMWTSALQECESALGDEESVKPYKNPLRETANDKQKSASALRMKRRSVNRLPCKSPKKPRPEYDSATTFSPSMEYIVMVSNLPKKMTKTEIKELFGCPNIVHKNVLHLLDKEGNRTDTAFLIFNCIEDYEYAMNLSGCHVGSDTIKVSSITKKLMRDMMAKTHPIRLKHHLKMDTKKKPNGKRKSGPVGTSEEKPNMNPDSAVQACLFVRNMPGNVQKCQIKNLFNKYKLKEDNIILLRDSGGRSTGEAVVKFKSQKHAALAHGLHGQDFLGTEVLLTRINVKQMEDILARSGGEIEH
ncbi:RNA binding motif protein 12Ba [Seriola aureovittata]|uniref:RNA binding motif protein 12Ba n=1 Tax=Seriola aureovittata TaxID=2871759 RepID=UPI0024BE6138|nr:RNA binding motif protein 12Ba [Seriola aureovittata]XP_056237440.1 RNA binding motif protein 12Ba [Seriola aureovittata]XP_056237441.1 RNA binding motif protein 12Ba [Seriola aureovittata]